MNESRQGFARNCRGIHLCLSLQLMQLTLGVSRHGVRRARLPTSGLSNRSVGLFTSPQCAALMIGWLFLHTGSALLHAQQRQSECPGSRTTVKIAKWFQLGMFECLV